MTLPIFRASLARDEDVVQARQWARAVAAGLGFSLQDQTRIATAVSEIARNAVAYARQGRIEFALGEVLPRRQGLVIRVVDAGRGIAEIDDVLAGRYRSATGLGLGIAGAQRLMDAFDLATGASGTMVTMGKALPGAVPLSDDEIRKRAQRAAAELERVRAPDPVAEVQQQNRELLASLARLREREEELLETNRELRETTDALSLSLREKEVLIREVHHRVKNNLQIISSLISLQATRSRSAEAKQELTSLSGRIRSLSLIHDRLYQGDNLARIDLRDYMAELCAHLGALFDEPGRQVTLTYDFCALVLPLDAAINLGLIVNELVTNAYKHAFPADRPGEIRVAARTGDGVLALTVADNGRGLPDLPEDAKRSLGMVLVRNMTARLGGSLGVEGDGGTRVTVTVPLAVADAGGDGQQPAAAG